MDVYINRYVIVDLTLTTALVTMPKLHNLKRSLRISLTS